MIAPKEVQLVEETVKELYARGQGDHARAVEAVLAVATSPPAIARTHVPHEYLTTGQAADVLGVTRRTIGRWVAAGQLEGARIGGQTLVRRDDVQRRLGQLAYDHPERDTHTPEAARAAERKWQEFLAGGLPSDKVARLEVLHEKLEGGHWMTAAERKEMAALERDVTGAARQRLEGWIQQSRVTQQ